jgi:hypothetical protein
LVGEAVFYCWNACDAGIPAIKNRCLLICFAADLLVAPIFLKCRRHLHFRKIGAI